MTVKTEYKREGRSPGVKGGRSNMPRLYRVTVSHPECEYLFWADSRRDARQMGADWDDQGPEVSAVELDPQQYLDNVPDNIYAVTVRKLLTLSKHVVDNAVQEARIVRYGEASWWSNGHAAYPRCPPCWVEKSTGGRIPDLGAVVKDALALHAEGRLPQSLPSSLPVEHDGCMCYRVTSGNWVQVKYLDLADPAASWYQEGRNKPLLAMLPAGGDLVAVVMPILELVGDTGEATGSADGN